MITVSSLFIYPVKSLGGIAVSSVAVTARGFEHDRRWMLVDEKNVFLTQRAHAQMALLKTAIEGESIIVFHVQNPSDIIKLPLQPAANKTTTVRVWDDLCEAQVADESINAWFSEKLRISCKAVFMPESTERKVDERYAMSEDNIHGFADGYPILMISEASLADLNNRLEKTLTMDRFRPNLVISGTAAFAEDSMQAFRINGGDFYGVKLCGRCNVTTIDQQTGESGKEPLTTLATYRTINKKVCFGQNVIAGAQVKITLGDTIEIVREGMPEIKTN